MKIKAIAKHDCEVQLTMSLDSLSLNRIAVKKGCAIELPVFKDTTIPDGNVADVLGKRCVVFQDEFMLIPTFSKDFDYTEF